MKPIQQEYENIHWKGKREKFKAEHGDELNRLQKAGWLREKLVKSMRLASPIDKEQRAALKAERAQLEAECKSLSQKLKELKKELSELNRVRYWTRKVMPDALPRVSDGWGFRSRIRWKRWAIRKSWNGLRMKRCGWL